MRKLNRMKAAEKKGRRIKKNASEQKTSFLSIHRELYDSAVTIHKTLGFRRMKGIESKLAVQKQHQLHWIHWLHWLHHHHNFSLWYYGAAAAKKRTEKYPETCERERQRSEILLAFDIHILCSSLCAFLRSEFAVRVALSFSNFPYSISQARNPTEPKKGKKKHTTNGLYLSHKSLYVHEYLYTRT